MIRSSAVNEALLNADWLALILLADWLVVRKFVYVYLIIFTSLFSVVQKKFPHLF